MMMSDKTGEPDAMKCSGAVHTYSDRYWLAVYAGQAMQGIMSSPEMMKRVDDLAQTAGLDLDDAVTVVACRMAVRMLAELNRERDDPRAGKLLREADNG